jgi:hypothetical protein
MTAVIPDVRYALRQLRRTPAFTITVLLTLALGIGGNAAIFTVVNSVMLKNLPVTDPRALVRLGNNNDCCVNSGVRESGDYALFSTDTYEQLKKNAPEFEELAAMQAGFGYRPIIARRQATQARSVMAEFLSGNYFRTFGLQPQVGRLLMDADDIQGALMTAVMSYEAWQHDYAGDTSVVGSTFWLGEYKTGEGSGHRTGGLVWRSDINYLPTNQARTETVYETSEKSPIDVHGSEIRGHVRGTVRLRHRSAVQER